MNFREEIMSNEFKKYHILGLLNEKGKPLDAVIHTFNGVDKGDPHDHPYTFQSTVLSGWYIEEIYIKGILGTICRKEIRRQKGETFIIYHDHVHKIVKMSNGGCNTLILPQKKVQESGFWRFENGKAYRRQWNEIEFKLYDNPEL